MKYKIALLLPALALMAAGAFAQSKETRNVDTFTKISFRSPGKLYLRQGSPQKVEVEGNKDITDRIDTEVNGGKLTISIDRQYSNHNHDNTNGLKIYITVKDIEAVDVSGSGDLVAETKITGTNLDLGVSGSGSMEGEVAVTGSLEVSISGSGGLDLKASCKQFNSDISGSGGMKLAATVDADASFELSGSGTVRASGKAQSVRASLSGSGRVLAGNLETDQCRVTISGSGDVEINVKNDLDANIAGSGSVSYRGNPSHVNSHSAGSGRVSKMN